MLHGGPPRVSILLPAYQAAATLEPCLRSIQRQTLADWECLLLDDGSSDQTLELAYRFADRDARFLPIPLPRAGLVATLNAGIALARAPAIARMDADDLMHSRRLELQLEHLEAHPELSLTGAGVRIFPRATLREGRRHYERWLNHLRAPGELQIERFIECPLAHPTWLMRSPMARALEYRDLGWPEDYDFLLRALEQGYGLGTVPQRLLLWRDLPTRLSRTHGMYRLERFVACKAHFLARQVLTGQSRYLLWGHGPTGRALKRALQIEGKWPCRIVEVHPRRIGEEIQGVEVIAPDRLDELRGIPLVAAVSGLSARTLIRDKLSSLGWIEGRDYWCAA